MNCTETQRLVHAYVDNELDLTSNLEFERHLEECPACAQAYQALQATRASVKGGAPYFEAPLKLRERIHASVASTRKAHATTKTFRWQKFALAASLLIVVASAGWGLIQVFGARSADAALTEQLVANHVRSQMLPGHRLDVESSDTHTVKPWFAGKLDFSPAVYDFKDEGFPLIGGRLEYLDQRPVAALVIKGVSTSSMFVWPSGGPTASAERMLTRQGYHLLYWNQSGTTYWAVSDLNESELKAFAGLLKEKDRQ